MRFLWRDRGKRHLDEESASCYVDGQLQPWEARRVAEHLQQCKRCRQQVEQLRGMVELLRSFPAALPPTTFNMSPRPEAKPVIPSLPLRLAWSGSIAALLLLVATVTMDRAGAFGSGKAALPVIPLGMAEPRDAVTSGPIPSSEQVLPPAQGPSVPPATASSEKVEPLPAAPGQAQREPAPAQPTLGFRWWPWELGLTALALLFTAAGIRLWRRKTA